MMKKSKETVDEIVLDAEELKDFDLMRNPEIRNMVLETVEEWKSVRDSICRDSGIKCNTCKNYNKCDKKIYDIIHDQNL